MNCLHFSTRDIEGGAAQAAFFLHSALREAGCNSEMVVRFKESDRSDVYLARASQWRFQRNRIMRRLLSIGSRSSSVFNFDLAPDADTQLFFGRNFQDADIICMHWVTGLLSVNYIRRIYDYYQVPLIWVVMDQEPITGGCHYSFGCDGYARQCGCCPQLNSTRQRDYSRLVWLRKQKLLQDLPITFIAGTSWVSNRLRASSLYATHRIEFIPLAIDTNVFRPRDRCDARMILELPQDKLIVFFGAYSVHLPAKGMAFLLEALNHLLHFVEENKGIRSEDIFLLMAGHDGEGFLDKLPFAGRALGYLSYSDLALAYQAADLFVCPSVEDAGPLMIPEGMLCGTPVAAFNTGGAPDIIESMTTGYLAKYKDSMDLGHGIYEVLASSHLQEMGVAASQVALARHAPAIVASAHLDLYKSLLDDFPVRRTKPTLA